MSSTIQLTSTTWQPGSGLAASHHVRPERLAPTFAPVSRGEVCLNGAGLPGGYGLQGARFDATSSGAMTGLRGRGLPVQTVRAGLTVEREAVAGGGNAYPATVLTFPAIDVPMTDLPTTSVPTTPVRTDKHDPGSTVWRESV